VTVLDAPSGTARLLLGVDAEPMPLPRHLAVHGRLPGADQPRRRDHPLLAAVEGSGLTGRGGAAFPLTAKMRTVAATRGRGIVVVNAAESEPASGKDHHLVTRVPHLVLDGAHAAAEAVGASEVVVWLHRGDPRMVEVLENAIAERRDHGDLPRPTRLALGPDRYVAGDSSALVHHLSGGPALPRTTRKRTAEKGVRGRPTLVANAETCAHLALIARHGADWFRSVGTADEPGTMLATVRGAVARPGVVEVPVGSPLSVLVDVAGGATAPVAAFLVGGYGGTWLPGTEIGTAQLSRASMSALGADLGVGLVVVLPQTQCPVEETSRLLGWLAAESTGQCGPCINGLPAIAERFAAVADGRGGPDAYEKLRRWAGLVTGRGACSHPDGAARLLLSALRVFEVHVEEHARQGRCGVSGPPLPLPVPAPAHRSTEVWR
jgi:NADH:ubiquinone oxidoreductase subunit F (NADH-binding)